MKTQAHKLPLLGFAAGLGILALAWGVKGLNPIVRWLMTVSVFAIVLSHGQTVIAELKGVWKQL